MIFRRVPARRRPLVAVMLLTGLLLAADTLAWLQMQRLLEHRLRILAQDAARSGWQLEVASEQRGGWPAAAELTLAAPRMHGAETLWPGGITWSAERITASLSPLHPRHVTIHAAGTQTVSAGGATSTRDSLRFWSAGTALHLPAAAADGAGETAFDAAALHLALPGDGAGDVVTVAGLHGTIRWNRQALALALALRGIDLPRGRRITGQTVIPAASLELSLVGRLGSGGGVADRLRAWRAGQGRLLLRQLAVQWSDAGITASGQATLDGNLQPDGGFTVRITGADAMLDKLAQSGRIDPPAASAIRAVLGLISAAQDVPRPGDARRLLELPLSLHAGLLSLGQIPLLRIPAPTAAGVLP